MPPKANSIYPKFSLVVMTIISVWYVIKGIHTRTECTEQSRNIADTEKLFCYELKRDFCGT